MTENYSVLMSVYIKEKPEYLKEAITSILNQTVKTNDFVIEKSFTFISFKPTLAIKKEIKNADIPTHRLISKSDKYAPKAPVQLRISFFILLNSFNGKFSNLL